MTSQQKLERRTIKAKECQVLLLVDFERKLEKDDIICRGNPEENELVYSSAEKSVDTIGRFFDFIRLKSYDYVSDNALAFHEECFARKGTSLYEGYDNQLKEAGL